MLSNSSFNNVVFDSCTLSIETLEKSYFNSCRFNNCTFLEVKGAYQATIFNSSKFNNCIYDNSFLFDIKNIKSKVIQSKKRY